MLMKRYKASYYGALVGDAMGVPLKFEKRDKLIANPTTSMIGYGSYNAPKGSWSCGSSMMLATMDSISSKNKIDYDDIMSKFSQWISFAKYTSTGEVFDIGRTTLKAISRFNEGYKPIEAGLEGINYNGNGALTRMFPIAFYAYYTNIEENDIIDLVCNASSLTHAHEISKLGCYIFVRYIMFLLDDHNKQMSYNLIKMLNYSSFSIEAKKEYKRLLEGDIVAYSLDSISSSGYIVDTLEAVIWCINNTDNFSQAVIGAINLGGDTDTIGALTGGLAGIIYGFDSIPKHWIDDLEKKDYLKLIYTSFIKSLSKLG